MSQEDRIAYLAGVGDPPLSSKDIAEAQRLQNILSDEALWVEPDPDLEQRVVDLIGSAASERAPDSGIAPVSRIRTPRPRRRKYTLLGIAAAIILAAGLAVGISVAVSNSGPSARKFAATLSGTQLAPGASGKATLTQTSSGWRIHLDAIGLPRLDNGRFYQAWLKNAAGRAIPIGTFNEGRDVMLWAGVPPADYGTMTVTRQTAQGGPASSGQVVLVGPTRRVR
jgi:Anti-sigma-K factor rskA